jgi:pectate lyase
MRQLRQQRVLINKATYVYTWGVGVASKIFAENNIFIAQDVTPDQLIRVFNGNAIHASGTVLGPQATLKPVDVVPATRSSDVGWTPGENLVTRFDPRPALLDLLRSESGALS